ncbi:DUF368 domain-containing protein [Parasporobacterium paucivorans]|uniref:Putative membrane protein n=1 Tax=Parasporobacterium paucivorans DSM 15970 TaxID=1122934 RepID=A0A1M6G4Q6_9FIRM|nr:DUF368 domain-containing protein [Parasporobacterium paucivorans]SHJ04939.1 putative membrane protein [Parasporobacterium paucivorans DSM 15970]
MINILKGIMTAISLLVPGVSGGTMMIVLGVYDKAIESISELISRRLVHIKMLIQLAIGGIIGLVLFSNAMLYVLKAYPYVTSFLFLGIVVTGLYAILNKLERKEFRIYHVLFFVAGLAVALVMTHGKGGQLVSLDGSSVIRVLVILIAGIIIAVALILPGISTSYLLLALGVYNETLEAIKSIDIGFLLPLAIGVILGVLLTTKLLEYLMKNHPNPTYLTILGFVIGSLGGIYPGIPASSSSRIGCAVAFLVGAAIMVAIQVFMKKHPGTED